jgi:hypothetical protein
MRPVRLFVVLAHPHDEGMVVFVEVDTLATLRYHADAFCEGEGRKDERGIEEQEHETEKEARSAVVVPEH